MDNREPSTAGEGKDEAAKCTSLEIYDRLRDLQKQLREIPDPEDEWESNALQAVDAVLYLAQNVFAQCRANT